MVRVGADAAPEEVLSALYDKVTLGGFVLSRGGRKLTVGPPSTASARRIGVEEPLESTGSGVGWRKVG